MGGLHRRHLRRARLRRRRRRRRHVHLMPRPIPHRHRDLQPMPQLVPLRQRGRHERIVLPLHQRRAAQLAHAATRPALALLGALRPLQNACQGAHAKCRHGAPAPTAAHQTKRASRCPRPPGPMPGIPRPPPRSTNHSIRAYFRPNVKALPHLPLKPAAFLPATLATLTPRHLDTFPKPPFAIIAPACTAGHG